MSEEEELQFCATKLPRNVLKTLKDIAFERHMTLKELLNDVLTNFAKENMMDAMKP